MKIRSTRSGARPLRGALDLETTRAWMRASAAAFEKHCDWLTQLDAAIGDADHGTNMRRGFRAVITALDEDQARTVGEVLTRAGTVLRSEVGGASGPLYGAAFRAAGAVLTEPTATSELVLAALRAATSAVQELGSAVPGDKTMLDALVPAVTAFEEAVGRGAGMAVAALAAARAAEAGARAAIPLRARKGRASYLGPRSIGHLDPGATSTALMFAALADVLGAEGTDR